MPANRDEIEAAEQEKIEFVFQTNVVKICGDNKVEKVECDTGKIIETDMVIMAIGSTPNENYIDEKLKLTEQSLEKFINVLKLLLMILLKKDLSSLQNTKLQIDYRQSSSLLSP